MDLQNMSIKVKDLDKRMLAFKDAFNSLLKTQQELIDDLPVLEQAQQEEMIVSYTDVILEKFADLKALYKDLIDSVDNIGL